MFRYFPSLVVLVDRGDTGYSPIWRMWWVTELPMNYNADEFSHPSQLFMDGVKISEMPMWVNCPNVGVNGDVNPNKKTDGFEFEIDASKESNWVMGSDALHAMGGEKEIVISGISASTNGMGVYQHELKSCDIAPSATTVDVEFEGTTLREIEVVNRGDDSCEENAPAPTPDATIPDAPTPESATTSIFKRSALFANAIGFFLASLVL